MVKAFVCEVQSPRFESPLNQRPVLHLLNKFTYRLEVSCGLANEVKIIKQIQGFPKVTRWPLNV